jgi:dTDP-4-dehydrorhamnose reductase
VASEPISKLDLLTKLRQALGLDIEIVPADEPYGDRSLDGSRFEAATGVSVPPWDRMIAELAADRTPYDDWRDAHDTT